MNKCFKLYIGENLCHDWILAPLKESEETVSDDDVTADANGQTTGQANKEEIQAAREALIEEALRVVKGMDKWIPGKVGGKTVRVMYVLPISFMLK